MAKVSSNKNDYDLREKAIIRSFKKSLFFISIFLFLLCVSILILMESFQYFNYSFSLMIFISVCLLAIFSKTFCITYELIEPPRLFSILFIFFNIFIPACFLFYPSVPHKWYLRTINRAEYIEYIIVLNYYSIICLIAFLSGYSLKTTFKNIYSPKPKESISQEAYIRTILVISTIGILCYLYVISKIGGINFLLSNLSSFRSSTWLHGQGLTGGGIFGYAYKLTKIIIILPALYYGYCLHFNKIHVPRHRILYYTISIISFLLLASLGGRQTALSSIIIVFFMFIIFRYRNLSKLKKKLLLFRFSMLASIILLYIIIFPAIRTNFNENQTITTDPLKYFNNKMTNNESIYKFLDNFNTIDIQIYCLKTFPKQKHFNLGTTFLYPFTYVLKQFFPIPHLPSADVLLANYIYERFRYPPVTPGPNLFCELYINFSWFGIAVFFILGVIMKRFFLFYSSDKNNIFSVILCCVLLVNIPLFGVFLRSISMYLIELAVILIFLLVARKASLKH